VELLPALPPSWSQGGRVRGLRTRCGVEVGLEWQDGVLARATLAWVWEHVAPRPIAVRSQWGRMHARTSDRSSKILGQSAPSPRPRSCYTPLTCPARRPAGALGVVLRAERESAVGGAAASRQLR